MHFPKIIIATKEPELKMFEKYPSPPRKKGESEYLLFEHLQKRKLPVFQNLYLNPYSLDILFMEKKNKLIIDIEIDEPYEKELGKPVHYIENDLDYIRDKFMIEKGINVIRFSEKQVISNINICYLIIDYFIKSLTDFKNESALKHWCNKISEPKWSKNQSELLFQNRARDIYPFDIIFESTPVHKIKINKPINFFTDPVLKVLSTDDIIEIPTLINRIINHSTKEVGFSYYGLHFSNSEYHGNCQELTKVRIIKKDSLEYPFFEKYIRERIQFIDKNYDCIPFMIIKSGPNHDSNDIKLIN